MLANGYNRSIGRPFIGRLTQFSFKLGQIRVGDSSSHTVDVYLDVRYVRAVVIETGRRVDAVSDCDRHVRRIGSATRCRRPGSGRQGSGGWRQCRETPRQKPKYRSCQQRLQLGRKVGQEIEVEIILLYRRKQKPYQNRR